MKKIVLLLIFVFLLVPSLTSAKIGVGIGTGKIQVDEVLKPGLVYELPSLTVVNTGDETSDYELAISYHEEQQQLAPPQTWFVFTPEKFSLAPGEVKNVTIKLNLPVRMEPGNYFAYLEAHPIQKSASGETSIGIAAAAKLYFTVAPGSTFEGVYYKAVSLWNVYAPWPQRVAIGIGVVFVLFLFKKFFNIEVNLKKPSKSQQREDED